MADARWEEIKARSIRKLVTSSGRIMPVHCGDCDLSYHHGGGFPCPKHATPDELEAVARFITETKIEHPLLPDKESTDVEP